MTNTPKTGADTGLPEFKDTTTKYVKCVSPVVAMTEPEWFKAAQVEISLMDKANECRQALFARNGYSIPAEGLDADLWDVLSALDEQCDEAIKHIVDGFDWPISRGETVEGRKQ